jgi:hypothetical protein
MQVAPTCHLSVAALYPADPRSVTSVAAEPDDRVRLSEIVKAAVLLNPFRPTVLQQSERKRRKRTQNGQFILVRFDGLLVNREPDYFELREPVSRSSSEALPSSVFSFLSQSSKEDRVFSVFPIGDLSIDCLAGE